MKQIGQLDAHVLEYLIRVSGNFDRYNFMGKFVILLYNKILTILCDVKILKLRVNLKKNK